MNIARKITEVKYVSKGPQGNKGAKLRMRQWAVGQNCLSGADNETYYDVVVYNDKLYLCLKSHTTSTANNPQTSVSQNLGFWEIAQDWVFIATKLLLAEKINSDQIDVDSLRVKHLDGADGSINIAGGKVIIEDDGSGHLANGRFAWDSDGNYRTEGVHFAPFANMLGMSSAGNTQMKWYIDQDWDGNKLKNNYIATPQDGVYNYVQLPDDNNSKLNGLQIGILNAGNADLNIKTTGGKVIGVIYPNTYNFYTYVRVSNLRGWTTGYALGSGFVKI